MSKKLFLLLLGLTLLLVNAPAAVAQVHHLTIGLIGDSTVATTYGWGPAFEEQCTGEAKVLHFAKNGATLESLSKRMDELLQYRPDYVIIQFGHNDQKKYGPDVYRTKLTSYIQRAKQVGVKPIVFSSVTRRNFGDDGKIQPRVANLKGDLPSFAATAEAVAKEQGVPFVDLYRISVNHHNTIGPGASQAYNFNPTDTTHFSPEGADATAKLIIAALRTEVPELDPFFD
ncbi:Rhamnogalacturonan acetylesterase RhgT [Stieleria maiorica]|uniref:Rhamnogalacturonan acetylesterase RhgT n=1 Tax=Stieleria maiorica TaxID=2795974 RepID=A0A5B9MCP3_9BACT|nr:rhamnogalacturonan acetylesterase [Stieleria maiorica]QEF97255.1 Rhamnogalacturonan acetylesterase RhgT [Stieleria maiorica]